MFRRQPEELQAKASSSLGADLSPTPLLELMARFLAGQAWAKEICRPGDRSDICCVECGQPLPREPDAGDAPIRALLQWEYIERHWRNYQGPAAMQIMTCLKKPSRAALNEICAATGEPASVVLAVWDAGVIAASADIEPEPEPVP